VLISSLDKLVYLLPGLERVDVNISSHVEVVVLEVAFERKITNMSEDSSSLHFVILPASFVTVAITPNVSPEPVLDPMVELAYEDTLVRIRSNPLSVLAISIPEPFILAHDTVVWPVEDLNSRTVP
jgi:hypothetical protein